MKTLLTFLVIILILTTAQAQEIDATLSGNTSSEGFTVKNLSGTTLFRVRGDGNVGIGTFTPGKLLDINGSARASSFIGRLNASNMSYNYVPVFRANISADLDALSNSSIFVKSSGDVGIGTTNPGATLHVGANDFLVGPDAGSDLSLEISGVDVKLGDIWGNQFGNYLFIDAEGSGNFQFLGGNVGIGTSGPTELLEIEGGASTPTLRVSAFTNVSSQIQLIEGNFAGAAIRYDAGNDRLSFIINSSDPPTTERMVILRSSGNVGINNTAPNVKLDVIGSIEYTGTITDVSDARLKENIVLIENALEKIQAINGVYFNMIDTPERKDIGVIAQNVKEVLPEAVSVVDPEEGYLGVSYPSLIPVLIEAIKEQQKQIEELERRISSLSLKENNKTSYGYTKTNMNH